MKKFSFIAAAAILSAAGALSAQTILNTTLLDGFDTDTSGDWVVTNGDPVGYNATIARLAPVDLWSLTTVVSPFVQPRRTRDRS